MLDVGRATQQTQLFPGVYATATRSARVDADNAASARLLDRLGFIADGRTGSYLRYVLRTGGSPESC